MKTTSFIKILLVGIPLVCISCKKLDPEVYDQVTNLNQIPDQIGAGVGSVYSGMRNYAPTSGIYNLNEVSTDEIIVPNRLTDWADGVIWEEMWKHTWGPHHELVIESWQFIYSGIARVNSILQAIEDANPKPANSSSIQAEMKTMRAFYYYQALDLFGNVPIADINVTDLSKLGNKPRIEVFNYVEKELKQNLAAVSKEVNSKTYGRATHWFAQSILVKLYLNAQIFTGTPRWLDCIAACDAIINSNLYSLEPNFFDNFLISNEGSRENIFVIPFDVNAGLNYFWIQSATLHYNSDKTFGMQFYPGGFNGHCSTAEYYAVFDPKDIRRKMFLVGQQYVNEIPDQNHLQYDNFGNLLNFDPVITSFVLQPPKTETAGARCVKWEINRASGGLMNNDFAVYRLADIILMKAEAQFRNGNTGEALATINQKINGVSIRSRTGLTDFKSSEMNLEELLKERARELSWEGHRRNDLIRFGHFTDARIPEKALSGNFRNLYPIPKSEIDKNPLYLKQNPGY